ncbi:MAG: hypothetical protein G3W61_26180, partial [Xanthomonas perforans]|nr:hypothetical protein [Xanthomonas perforans]
VFLGAGILVSVVVTLLAVFGLGTGIAGGIMVGTALMLAAMFFSSVVFTFRDCFEPPEKWTAHTAAEAADGTPADASGRTGSEPPAP